MSELLAPEGLEERPFIRQSGARDGTFNTGGNAEDDDACSEEDELSPPPLSDEQWLVRRQLGIEEFLQNYDPTVWVGDPFVWDRTTGLVTRDVRNCGDRYDMDDN